MRPFSYQDWQIETSYTHFLHFTDPGAVWNKLDPRLQAQITSSGELLSFKIDLKDTRIRSFSVRASQTPHSLSAGRPLPASTIEKAIRWMGERDLCRLVALSDKNGRELAVSLLILSRENRTIYVWKTVYRDRNLESEILPFLTWQSYLHLADGFDHMDLGGSPNQAISQLKDRLGCELLPKFTTKYKYDQRS